MLLDGVEDSLLIIIIKGLTNLAGSQLHVLKVMVSNATHIMKFG
jgi:hypothetical protein